MVYLIVLLSLLTSAQASQSQHRTQPAQSSNRQYFTYTPMGAKRIKLAAQVEKLSKGAYIVSRGPEFFLLDKATGTRVQHNGKPISAEAWLAQQNQKPKQQSR